jgi:hypothetical protein
VIAACRRDVGPESVEIHGHCAATRAAIAAVVRRGRDQELDRLVDSQGHFVLVARAADEDVVVCSRSGIVGYYWAVGPRVVHGVRVADVAAEAGLPFAWDWTAVADRLAHEHPLGDAAVQAGVRRLCAASVSRVDHASGSTTVRVVPEPRADAATSPETCIELLVETVRASGQDCALSFSGGLDSRLLLAALLALGRRPLLLTSGVPGSFDREVSTAVAARFGLRLRVTHARAESIADTAAWAAVESNSVVSAPNWAGLEHLRAARATTSGPVMLGFGGECARSYYAAQRGLTALRQAANRRPSITPILRPRLQPTFAPRELERLASPLRDGLELGAIEQRITASTHTGVGDAFDGADDFYLQQYCRQKLGADLACVGAHVEWRVPLLGREWVAAVGRLDRRWKLGDRLHRYGLQRLCVALTCFPESGRRHSRTAVRAPLRYWLAGLPGQAGADYLGGSLFTSSGFRALLADQELPELVDRSLLEEIASEHASSGARPGLAFALLALSQYRRYAIARASAVRAARADRPERQAETRDAAAQPPQP